MNNKGFMKTVTWLLLVVLFGMCFFDISLAGAEKRYEAKVKAAYLESIRQNDDLQSGQKTMEEFFDQFETEEDLPAEDILERYEAEKAEHLKKGAIEPEKLPQNSEGKTRIKELKNKNTEYATFYQNDDGTESVDVSISPIRYKNKTGDLVDIDTNLVKNKNSEKKHAFKVASSDVNVFLEDDLEKKDAALIEYGKYSISFQFLKDDEMELEQKVSMVKEQRVENEEKLGNLKKALNTEETVSRTALDSVESTEETIISSPSKKIKDMDTKMETVETEDNASPQMPKNETTQEKQYSSVIYKNMLEEAVEMQLFPTSTGIKEDIILNSLPQNHWFSYRFTISENIYIEKDEQGNVFLKDKKSHEEIGIIAAPYMIDSSEDEKESAEIVVEAYMETETSFVYSIMPSREFLEEESTVYPVRIDPSIRVGGVHGIQDTYISTETPGTAQGLHTSLRLGRDTNNNVFRGYMKIHPDHMPNLGETAVITNSRLYMYQAHTGTTQPRVRTMPMAEYVDTRNVTWYSAKGSVYNFGQDVKTVGGPGWYNWDTTHIMRRWQRYGRDAAFSEKGVPNYGLMFVSDNEGTMWYKRFNSSDNASNTPYFTIDYVTPGLWSSYHGPTWIPEKGRHFDVSWEKVNGASAHMGLWNGSEYQYYDMGSKTSFSSDDESNPNNLKRMWPTDAEVGNGRYTFHTDGQGREYYPNVPYNVYRNNPASNAYNNSPNYYFAMKYKDGYGEMGVRFTNFVFPDFTPPEQVRNVQASYNEITDKLDISFDPAEDLPAYNNVGVMAYSIYIKVKSTGEFHNVRGLTADQHSTSIPAEDLPQNEIIQVYVLAMDYNRNSNLLNENTSCSSEFNMKDRIAPNAPTSLAIEPNSWTKSLYPVLSWEGITDDTGPDDLHYVEYSVDNGRNWTRIQSFLDPDKDIWNNSTNIDCSDLHDGTHVVLLRGVDYAENKGSTKSVTYYKDTTAPYYWYEDLPDVVMGYQPIYFYMFEESFSVSYKFEMKKGPLHTTIPFQTLYASPLLESGDGMFYEYYEWDTTGLDEGLYTIRLTAIDRAGNEGTIVKEVAVSQDGMVQAPELIVTEPANDNPFEQGSTVEVNDVNQRFFFEHIWSFWLDGPGEIFVDNQKLNEEEIVNNESQVHLDMLQFEEGAVYEYYIDSDGYSSAYKYFDGKNIGNHFLVKLIEEPKNLSVIEQANYTIWLRWDPSETDDVTYQVYRGDSPDFVPDTEDGSNLIRDNVEDYYIHDYDINYGRTNYYKVVAVKEFDGKPRYSVPSVAISGTVVEEGELDKKLGLQEFWDYAALPAGNGEGNVNIGNGNLVYVNTDFVNASPQLASLFRRTFNSQATYKSAMGQGWDFNYNTNLMREYDANGEEIGMVLKDGDGTLHRFYWEEGKYSSPQGIYMELFQEENGSFIIQRGDNIKYHFNSNLQLESFSDLNGNEIKLTYDSRGNVVKVFHNVYENKTEENAESTSHYIQLSYNQENDRLWYVGNHFQDITGKGNKVNYYYYGYDQSDNLNKVKTGYNSSLESRDEEWMQNNGRILESFSYGENSFVAISPSNELHSANTRKTRFEFENGKVSTIINAVGEIHKMSYQTGKTKLETFGDGNSSIGYEEFSYDKENNNTLTQYQNSVGEKITKGNYDDNYNARTMSVWKEEDDVVTIEYTYDEKGNVTSLNKPIVGQSTFTYDQQLGKLIAKSVPGGGGATASSSLEYDDRGNLVKATSPEGKVIIYTYDEKGNRTAERGHNGTEILYEYDRYGRLIVVKEKVSEGEYRSTSYAYDVMNNPVAETDVLGRTVSHTYNDLGYRVRSEYPNGKIEEFDYNLNGLQVLYKENSSQNIGTVLQTRLEYDNIDRLVSTSNLQPGMDDIITTIDYSYENGKRVKTIVDAEGKTSRELYDISGNLLKESMGDGSIFVEYTYDLMGNLKTINDQTGNLKVATRDKLSRVTSIQTPYSENEKAVHRYTYDSMANVLTETDPAGNTTTNTYDVMGRLMSVSQNVDGRELTTSYTHYQNVDGGLLLSTVTDAKGGKSEVYSDRLGRPVKEREIGHSGGVKSTKEFSYDHADNLLSEKINGQTKVSYTYEANANLLKRKQFDGANFTEFTYDVDGRRLTMNDVSDGISSNSGYSYDILGRMIMLYQDGENVGFQYDKTGNVIEMSHNRTDGTSRNVQYQYNQFNAVSEVKQNGKTVAEYHYNEKGQLDTTVNYLLFNKESDKTGAKMEQSYRYDQHTGYPVEVLTKQEEKVYEKYSMEYNKIGYMTKESMTSYYDEATTKSLEKTYSYDSIGRLVSDTIEVNKGAENERKSTGYTYDEVGNRLTMNQDGTHFTYEYDQYSQLLGVTKNNQNHESYSYDAQGNMTQKKTFENGSLDLTQNMEYSAANQLKKVTSIKEGDYYDNITSYAYNGDGKRIRCNENGADPQRGTKYYYVGEGLLYTQDNDSGLVYTENILDTSGTILATKGKLGNEQYNFYNYDLRGSVTNIVAQGDSGGIKTIEEYDYDVFGNTKVEKSTGLKNEVQFGGALKEGSSGLYYMNARHYDPGTGRFLQQDVYKGEAGEPWTQNRYTYCGNNPVNMIDPSGHSFLSILGGNLYCKPPKVSNTIKSSSKSIAPKVITSAATQKNSISLVRNMISMFEISYLNSIGANTPELQEIARGVADMTGISIFKMKAFNYNGDLKITFMSDVRLDYLEAYKEDQKYPVMSIAYQRYGKRDDRIHGWAAKEALNGKNKRGDWNYMGDVDAVRYMSTTLHGGSPIDVKYHYKEHAGHVIHNRAFKAGIGLSNTAVTDMYLEKKDKLQWYLNNLTDSYYNPY